MMLWHLQCNWLLNITGIEGIIVDGEDLGTSFLVLDDKREILSRRIRRNHALYEFSAKVYLKSLVVLNDLGLISNHP